MVLGTACVDGLRVTLRQGIVKRVEIVYPDGKTETRYDNRNDKPEPLSKFEILDDLDAMAVQLIQEWAESRRTTRKVRLNPAREARKVIDNAISGTPVAEDSESKFEILRQRSRSGKIR